MTVESSPGRASFRPDPTAPPGEAGPAGEPSADAEFGDGHGPYEAGRAGCTQAQLRRFIKSRPYVPLHELRRRFAIDGTDDDVTAIEAADGRVFVGLPEREGRMLADLARHGEVGLELLRDPDCPMVVGVYPMRPVPRS